MQDFFLIKMDLKWLEKNLLVHQVANLTIKYNCQIIIRFMIQKWQLIKSENSKEWQTQCIKASHLKVSSSEPKVASIPSTIATLSVIRQVSIHKEQTWCQREIQGRWRMLWIKNIIKKLYRRRRIIKRWEIQVDCHH